MGSRRFGSGGAETGLRAGGAPAGGSAAPTPAFVCGRCGVTVAAEAPGTRQRNHCPRCLHSLHVDVTVGDRRALCRGLMEPISLWVREDGELSLLHRCSRCGVIKANRVAGDDCEEAVRALAAQATAAGRPRSAAGSRAAPA